MPAIPDDATRVCGAGRIAIGTRVCERCLEVIVDGVRALLAPYPIVVASHLRSPLVPRICSCGGPNEAWESASDTSAQYDTSRRVPMAGAGQSSQVRHEGLRHAERARRRRRDERATARGQRATTKQAAANAAARSASTNRRRTAAMQQRRARGDQPTKKRSTRHHHQRPRRTTSAMRVGGGGGVVGAAAVPLRLPLCPSTSLSLPRSRPVPMLHRGGGAPEAHHAAEAGVSSAASSSSSSPSSSSLSFDPRISQELYEDDIATLQRKASWRSVASVSTSLPSFPANAMRRNVAPVAPEQLELLARVAPCLLLCLPSGVQQLEGRELTLPLEHPEAARRRNEARMMASTRPMTLSQLVASGRGHSFSKSQTITYYMVISFAVHLAFYLVLAQCACSPPSCCCCFCSARCH